MQLYIKQKVFSWRDRFAVKDAAGNDRWYAQGELFSWGRKLHVYDARGNEAAFLRQKLWSFLEQKYFIELAGRPADPPIALVKEFRFVKRRYHLEGLPWRMDGDFWAHEYSLYEGDRELMHISKEWFVWGDSYRLDIADPRQELLCLCVALAVDCMNADAAAAAAATS
ncbi:MAG: LURP-one-related family protein [Oscillospiraceae bacterium]|nr:LURP-one-related family protein [Oscillospiraceae bacterium]